MPDVSFLVEYPIYRDFDVEDIDVLGKICTEESYKNGEYIFREGDPGDAMYIIKTGTVKIYKETKNRKKLITMLSDGEFFGEMTLIDSSPRSASVISGGNTELVRLSVDGFKELKTAYSRTGFKVVAVLLKFMSHRIRRTTKKAASLIKGRKKKKKPKNPPASRLRRTGKRK